MSVGETFSKDLGILCKNALSLCKLAAISAGTSSWNTTSGSSFTISTCAFTRSRYQSAPSYMSFCLNALPNCLHMLASFLLMLRFDFCRFSIPTLLIKAVICGSSGHVGIPSTQTICSSGSIILFCEIALLPSNSSITNNKFFMVVVELDKEIEIELVAICLCNMSTNLH